MRQKGELSFEYQVDAEPYYDHLNFYINKIQKFRESTQLSWKVKKNFYSFNYF